MRGERGSTHTLEAFIILAIMFGAVASVSNFRVARSTPDVLDELLTRKASDQLRMWADHPLGVGGKCDAATRLDRIIQDGLAQDHDEWNGLVKTRFPPGADVDMVLGNGHGLYPLHGSALVKGSGATYDWWPDLDYASGTTSLNAASGIERLTTDSMGVHWASLIRLRAEAIRFSARYLGTHASSVSTWAPTALFSAPSPPEERSFASTITWSNFDGTPSTLREISEAQAAQGSSQLAFFLNVSAAPTAEGLEGHLPAATTLTISAPRDWDGLSIDSPHQDWIATATPGAPGLQLRAVNNTTSRIFSILAVAPTTPTRPFDIISAKLSNGSLGQSNLIVTYPASTERGLPRILAPTAPYPVRNNSWVTFGAAFGNGGDPVTVTSFDIEIPGGYDMDHNGGRGAPLFAEIHPTERVPASGSWTILDGGRLIHWEGLAEVAQGSAAQFYAKVRITPDLQYATAIEPAWSNGPNATLTFDNGYFQSSTSWGKSPGIIRMQVPPASRATDDPQGGTLDGYPWSLAGRPVGEVRTIETKSNSVLAHLSNTTTYRLSPSAADAVALENALGNATFEMEDRLVRVGTEARVYADIESLVELVHGSGATGALTIDMYAPPSLFCAPTRSYQYNTLDLPRSAISAALLWQDGAVAPGFYVATEDGAVHRVEMTGFTAWSSSVSAGPTILKKMDLGLAGKYVVVGTNAGRVHAFDAADGTAQDRIATLDGAKLAPITAITIDPAGPWIYAADANGTVVVLDKDLHEHARASYGPSIRDIIVHGAHIYIHNATHLARLSGMLQEERSVLAEGPGFVRGRDWVYFAHPTMLARIDPLTLETVELDALDGTAHLTARGDATGDGIDDLIVGISGQRIRVIDGASESGVRAYNDIILDDPLIPRPDVSTLPELTGGIRDQPSATLSTAPLCEPRVVPAAYGTPVACTLSEGPGLIRAVAANGGLVVDVISNGLESVRRYGNDGHAQGIWWYTEGTTPRALDIGTMLTSSRAMIIGDSVGTATLYDDMGTPLVESTPSDRVGRFVFTTHIPEGGFFGTHLVVARLAWGAGVEPMEARLVEWFEAVAPDGSPVQRPAYRAALTIDDHMPTS